MEIEPAVFFGGIAAAFAGIGGCLRMVAQRATKAQDQLRTEMSGRIAAMESALKRGDLRNDDLNKYIREELAAHVAESHARERELVRIVRDHQDRFPDSMPAEQAPTAVLERSRQDGRRASGSRH